MLVMNETFGQRLSRLRKEKGLTQEDVANKIVISPQAVSKWENDVSSPDILVLSSLADILGVSVDELLGREKTTTTQASEEKEEPKEEVHEERETNVHQEEAAEVVDDNKKYRDDDDDDDYNWPRKPDKVFWITNSTLFGLALVAYILLGVLWKDQYMGWRMGWIVFLISICISSILNAVREKRVCNFAYPILIVGAYCALGFIGDYTGAFAGWATFWFLFLTIPAYYFIFGPVDHYIHRNDPRPNPDEIEKHIKEKIKEELEKDD